MRDILEALEEHKTEVFKHYPKNQVLGVFIYGSQNYGIATENSDVDTKAILIPTFEDLILRKPISCELHLKNGEHCEVKDIREMVKMFTKQNINFIEILFTKCYWVNPLYAVKWKKYFIDYRDEIAYMNPYQTIKSISGQAIHTLKQNPNDGKKYANGLRLFEFLKGYIKKEPYEKLLINNKEIQKLLIDYKTNKEPIPEGAVDTLIYNIKCLSDNLDIQDLLYKVDKDVLNIMNIGLINIIKGE